MDPKGLVTHFQKVVLFIMLWLTVSEILVFEGRRILLIANISLTVAQTPINHSIF